MRPLLATFCLLAVATCVTAQAQRLPKQATIMIVADGDSIEMKRTIDAIKAEISALLGDDTKVGFASPTVGGDWTRKGARAAVAQALSRPDVDLVIGVGPMTSVAVANTKSLPKPVLLPFGAPRLQGLPNQGGVSGKKNLAYIAGLINFEQDLRQLLDIVNFKHVTFIVGREVIEHVENVNALVTQVAKSLEVEASILPTSANAAQTLAALSPKTEIAYLGGLLRWSPQETKKLIEGLNERGIPSYIDSVRGVTAGALATTATEEDEVRRSRRLALYVQRALSGEDPGVFNVEFERRPELVINMATVRATGTWPRFEVMSEAKLINDAPGQRGRVVTLESAMQEALQMNLDVRASNMGVRASKAAVHEARSQYLPRAEATGNYTIIDKDVASSINNAERTLSWGISGSQLLYSPNAHAGLGAQKEQYKSDVAANRVTRLDTMLAAAEAYLNVLRAKTAERVNRNNLNLARTNLALAESRNTIGVAGREEVHRWQIEIAQARASVISASAQRNQAEIELNRILRQPLEAAFQTPEDQNEALVGGPDPRLRKYVDDPFSFRIFRDFMVDEAKRESPELKQLHAAVAANEKLLKGERRRLGIPDVALVGGFTHIPHVDGVGSEPIDPALLPGIPARDTFTWQVGVNATFNLFDGGENYAKVRRLNKEVAQVRLEKAATEQRIEQSIRSALHQASSSAANIGLQRDAAKAAAANLEMVTDSYQRGAVDIITLIDAQTQALTTQLSAANATYDFMIDLMRVERASGRFTNELVPEQLDDFYQRLAAFDAKQRAKIKETAR